MSGSRHAQVAGRQRERTLEVRESGKTSDVSGQRKKNKTAHAYGADWDVRRHSGKQESEVDLRLTKMCVTSAGERGNDVRGDVRWSFTVIVLETCASRLERHH